MRIFEMVEKLNNGMSEKELREELLDLDMKASEEPGKCFGKCESCEEKTCLVEEVMLCGPCCFGEAETANGNW